MVRDERYLFQSLSICVAAHFPGSPVPAPPGCIPGPQRKRPLIGVRCLYQPGIGLMYRSWSRASSTWSRHRSVSPKRFCRSAGVSTWRCKMDEERPGACSCSWDHVRWPRFVFVCGPVRFVLPGCSSSLDRHLRSVLYRLWPLQLFGQLKPTRHHEHDLSLYPAQAICRSGSDSSLHPLHSGRSGPTRWSHADGSRRARRAHVG